MHPSSGTVASVPVSEAASRAAANAARRSASSALKKLRCFSLMLRGSMTADVIALKWSGGADLVVR